MTGFDSWEAAIRPPEDYLMHFRTKGSKNGIRRYQTESGEWTELGLRERRKREGWGDGESKAMRKAQKEARKAERQVRKTEKAVAKSEKVDARRNAKIAAKAERAEKQRASNAKTMTTKELEEKIRHLKLEAELKELQRSPFVKKGEELIGNYLKNKADKAERAYMEKKEKLAREHEMAKMKEQTRQKELEAQSTKERAAADAKRAEADKARAETDKVDIEKGTRMKSLKNDAKSLKLQNKRYHSDYTIIGGIRKKINSMSKAAGEANAEAIRAYGESKAAKRRGTADARIAVKQSKILNKHNQKLGEGQDRAQIRESDQSYWNESRERTNNQNKKKEKNKNK